MSIGGTLADARHREGLTVAEVSARTRIGERMIRAIERDEFSGCGGDFYARGHIRAIAAVVGADPWALLSEYDAEHRSGGPAMLDDLLGQSPPPEPGLPGPPRRRRGSWLIPVAMLAFLGVVGYAAIKLTPGGGSPPAAITSSPSAAHKPAATHGPRPSPLAAPTAVSLTELTPVSAAAFGPHGTSDGDNPQNASLALSGDPATPWHTDWYTTARFGNLQAATGLLLDLGRTVTAYSVAIRLGNTPGADLEIRAGVSPARLSVVARATDAGGTVRLRLASRPHVRYVLIWFTLLPPDGAGTYQADISSVRVTAMVPNGR